MAAAPGPDPTESRVDKIIPLWSLALGYKSYLFVSLDPSLSVIIFGSWACPTALPDMEQVISYIDIASN
jgi:hypothetical protein